MSVVRRFGSYCSLLLLLGVSSCASSSPDGSDVPPSFPPDPLTTIVGQTGTVTIDVRTTPEQPPTRGVLDVELTVRDRHGATVDGASISVVPWMDSHGHGASTAPTVTSEGNGRYWVRDVDVFMPGQWELRIALSGVLSDHLVVPLEVQ